MVPMSCGHRTPRLHGARSARFLRTVGTALTGMLACAAVHAAASYHAINILPPVWQTITLFNPVVYLVSGFRWSFYGVADVSVGISLVMTMVFLAIFLAIVAWIFRTGYRLKS